MRHLLAVQAQDLRAAKLALRARGTGFGASDVDAALRDGTLVVAWLLRGTLHLVAREDHGWLLALTAPRALAAGERRLRQLELDPPRVEAAVRAIAAMLPATRAEIGARLGTTARQTAHLIGRAGLEGALVLGADGQYVSAPPHGGPGDLGARYLAAHAPATPEDLAHWSGLPLRDARAALSGASCPLSRGHDAPDPLGRRLLGMYDEYLLGWRDRSFAVPEALRRAVHPGGGIIRAVALEEGEVVATWSRADPPPAAFAAELDDVARFERG